MKRANLTSDEEDYSVKFHQLEGVEFWLTPLNRIFVKINGKVAFPSLYRGSLVKFDDPRLEAPAAVTTKLAELLRKQAQIRLGWQREDAERVEEDDDEGEEVRHEHYEPI